ncbi:MULTISPECIES: MFS transporter [Bartonella]|uniref:Major Facilitator Superfamily protein n=1 Tax=Bartonella choladocola TaxID=2750995 RepID=A0A1U9MKW9_9HYPH|nr:MFS transporter [Bartonella choladocola]AQT48380.1 Major Facilitator Superfamily protein [Bartonella choladocola]MBI0139366.1 MFS transporter [Bartonella choladocola]
MSTGVLPLPDDEREPPFPNPGKIFAGPVHKCLLYIFAASLLQWVYGLGANMVQSNITQLTGFFHATVEETTWLVGAYMAPNVSLSIFLIKIRNQYGLRLFAELSIIGFLLTCILHLFVTSLQSAIIIRFFAGIAAAPMSSLAFFYMIEAFAPAKKRTVGLSLNLMNIALAVPLSRLVSPALIDHAGFHALFALEMGLALIGFACIFYLPLTPIKRAKVIEKLDYVSYGLIAVGLGINAAIMPVGKLYWWREVSWMGWWLAIAVFCLMLASVIELNRKNPLIDLRWLFSKEMLHIAIVLLMFRILLSEQATLASNFFNLFGLLNREMEVMHAGVVVGTVLGGLSCAIFFKPGREDLFHVIALILLAGGSFMDSHATNLTRPDQMILSQAMIGVGYALFLPPSMSKGLATAIARGPNYILSFIAVFLFTQNTGGLMSSAFFGSLQIVFEKYHSNILTQQIVMSNPIVANGVNQLSDAYAHVISDPVLRHSEGLAALAKRSTLEANVLAYNDVFRLYSCIALIVLVMLLIRMALRGYKNFRDKQVQLSTQTA